MTWVGISKTPPSPTSPGLPKHPRGLPVMSTRIPAMFEIRLPATLQTFRRARPRGQAAVVPAAGVPLALRAPNSGCLTRRSSAGFRSATRCFRCSHTSLTSLDGPHDAHARVIALEIQPDGRVHRVGGVHRVLNRKREDYHGYRLRWVSALRSSPAMRSSPCMGSAFQVETRLCGRTP